MKKPAMSQLWFANKINKDILFICKNILPIPVQNKLKFRIEFLLLTPAHNFSCVVSNLYNPNRFNGFYYI